MSLEEIKKEIREELKLTRPPTVIPVSTTKTTRVEKRQTVEGSKTKISEKLAERLRCLEKDCGVLSFRVPDDMTSEIARSIQQWLPDSTRIVEATTVQVKEYGDDLVNSVVILCYSPISSEIGDFLTKVPKGSFRVVLVPSSTFERLPVGFRSEIRWDLGTRSGEKN